MVGHGNNGQWAYRKWNSGYMEMWRSTDASITVNITRPFYNWYYDYVEMKTNGVSIKTIENVHVSTQSGTELLFASLANALVLSDGNAQINFFVTNAREIRGKSVNLEISIKGRWK